MWPTALSCFANTASREFTVLTEQGSGSQQSLPLLLHPSLATSPQPGPLPPARAVSAWALHISWGWTVVSHGCGGPTLGSVLGWVAHSWKVCWWQGGWLWGRNCHFHGQPLGEAHVTTWWASAASALAETIQLCCAGPYLHTAHREDGGIMNNAVPSWLCSCNWKEINDSSASLSL